jgi:hypothetical protein
MAETKKQKEEEERSSIPDEDCIRNLVYLKFFKVFLLRVHDVQPREDMVHYEYVPPSGKKQRAMMVRVKQHKDMDETYDMSDMTTLRFTPSPSAMLNFKSQTYVPVFNANFQHPKPHTHALFPHKNGLIGCIINAYPYNDFIENFIDNNGASCRYPICSACSKITNGRKKCARCRTMYCDRICQEAHWPEHKAFCRSCA